jgi:site-specific DNA-cytosine methylase
MRILVACEFSGTVRDAFIAKGHDAWSCDIIPTERKGPHIVNDVRNVLDDGWDMMIAHPPCTHLAVSGARWFDMKLAEQAEAIEFVRLLINADIPHIAIENPVSIISSRIRKPDQIIQPWQFGETEQKKTCLWLKRLPPLFHTHYMAERNQSLWRLPPSEDRAKLRSATFQGIANAMAEQWSRVA